MKGGVKTANVAMLMLSKILSSYTIYQNLCVPSGMKNKNIADSSSIIFGNFDVKLTIQPHGTSDYQICEYDLQLKSVTARRFVDSVC